MLIYLLILEHPWERDGWACLHFPDLNIEVYGERVN